jgi:hypothetical protein
MKCGLRADSGLTIELGLPSALVQGERFQSDDIFLAEKPLLAFDLL